MKKKARKVIPWLIILAIAVVGLYCFVLRPRDMQYDEETARTQDIRTYYTFSGNLEPRRFKVVTAMGRGTVKEWKFAEGDRVEEDDVILQPKSGAQYKSPMAGTISDLYLDADEDFVPGDTLFRIADYDHPIVRIRVDEYDVSALAKDMSVTVRVQSTGEELTGAITRIAQEATVSNDLAYYEAEVSVPQSGHLAMGLTCEIVVPRESALNATTVSMDAIQYDDDGKPFVYCYSRGNEVVRQSVLLGINNGTIVEILDGVKSGETILLPPKNDLAMMPMMAR